MKTKTVGCKFSAVTLPSVHAFESTVQTQAEKDRIWQKSYTIRYLAGTLTFSAHNVKITNDGLTRSGTGCFIAVHIW